MIANWSRMYPPTCRDQPYTPPHRAYFCHVLDPPTTVTSVIGLYRARIAALHGEAGACAIVRAVIGERLGWDPMQLEMRRSDRLNEQVLLKLKATLDRIATGEPMQYVLGEVRFHGLRIKVDPSVLIPRPETEELVQLIIDRTTAPTGHVVDIGTGSGCIALALKQDRRTVQVTGIDISVDALEVCRNNAALNDLEVHWRQADVLDDAFELPPCDLVVSNPPYVPREDTSDMARHVVDHEPHLALFVPGDDPLLFYRKISAAALTALRPGGSLWFEGHYRTAPSVGDLLKKAGWCMVQVWDDMNGKPRFIQAVR